MAAPGAINLATAYVSISASTGGLGRQIQQTFGDKAMGQVGDSAGKSITGRLGGVLKKGAIGIGAAAGGVLGTALFKGFNRLSNIENATAKLSGLGNSAATVKTIMDDALKAVKGTAFGLDEAATVAAGAVASGVKPGKELQKTLTLVGDAATIGGTSMSEMGAIFNKVSATGKIQGEVINQLGERGIPILQLLGKQIGKTPAEVSKLASQGKIDFATFQKAMESGLGGAAQKSGETFKGALANAGAAMGRFGATLLKGVFPIAKTVLGGITTLFDKMGEVVGPIAERVSAALTGLVDNVSKFDFGKALAPIKSSFNDLWSGLTMDAATRAEFDGQLDGFVAFGAKLRKLWDTLVVAGEKLWPSIKLVGKAIGDAGAGLGIGAWNLFNYAIDGLVWALEALQPWLDRLSDWLKDPKNQALITGIATGIAIYAASAKVAAVMTGALRVAMVLLNGAIKVNPFALIVTGLVLLGVWFVQTQGKGETFKDKLLDIWTKIQAKVQAVVDWFKGFWSTNGAQITRQWDDVWNSVKATFDVVWTAIQDIARSVGGWLQKFWAEWGDTLIAFFKATWDNVKRIFDGVLTAIRGVFTVFAGIFTGDWGRVWEGLKTIFTGAWTVIKALIGQGVDSLKLLLSLAWAAIKSVASRGWDLITGAVSGAWAKVVKKVDDTITSVKRTLSGAWTTVKTSVGAAWDGIVTAVSTAWGSVVQAVSGPIQRVLQFVQENFIDKINAMFKALDLGIRIPTIWNSPAKSYAAGKKNGTSSGSWRTGGYTGNAGIGQVAGVVHGKEYVINAASTAKLMRENPGYLDGLNGYKGGGFVSPVNAPHGRWGRYASGGYHPAYDYPVPTGTPVKAPYDSTIIRDGWDSTGYGIHVRGLSTSGIYWVLGHNSREIVSPGQQVKAGQIVSYSGSTGRSSGPHVHFGTSRTPAMYGPGAFDPGNGRGVGGFLGASNLGADMGLSVQEVVSGQAGKIGSAAASGVSGKGGIFGQLMEMVLKKLLPGVISKGGNAGAMDKVRGQGGAIRPELHDAGRGVIMPGTHVISNRTKRPEYLLDEKNLSRIGGGADMAALVAELRALVPAVERGVARGAAVGIGGQAQEILMGGRY